MSGGVACLLSTLNCTLGQWMTGSGLALPQACTTLVWACKLAGTQTVASLHALQDELAEESCRVHQLHMPEELQADVRASAATSRGVAGATTAAADLPAQEAQQKQQQHQHQQECGGACDASSSDGAPITPTGQAAALPQQHHGSSDQEQGQWDAAGEEPAPP